MLYNTKKRGKKIPVFICIYNLKNLYTLSREDYFFSKGIGYFCSIHYIIIMPTPFIKRDEIFFFYLKLFLKVG